MTAEDVTVLTRKRQTAGYLLSEFRLKIKEVYEQIGTKEKAGLYSSIVLGDKSSLDGDIKKLYQRNGIAHIACGNGIIQAAAPRRNVICIFFCGRIAFYNRICSDDRKCAVRTAGIGDVSFDDVCTGARKNI